MKLIRNSIFETNSSSTHSLVIMSKQDYIDWVNNKKTLNIASELGSVKDLTEADKEIIRNEDGSIDYKGEHFESEYDFMESDYYDVIDDSNASKGYIDEYAEVIKKEHGDEIILSVYRSERW